MVTKNICYDIRYIILYYMIIITTFNYYIQENQQLLKKLFKRLDPSVSAVSTDVQGEVQVSLKYDFNNSRLLVNVIKCRDLGLNNITGKTAEPFVSVSMQACCTSQCVSVLNNLWNLGRDETVLQIRWNDFRFFWQQIY